MDGTKLQVEVRMPKLARVRPHQRRQNGRVVKIRSYYRLAWKTEVVIRISTR